MKKTVYLAILVTLVGWVVGGNVFMNYSGDGRWDNPLNWSGGAAPQSLIIDPPTIGFINDAEIGSGHTALIDSVTTASAYGLKMGYYGGVSGVNMTGGSLTIGNWGMNIGRGGNGNMGHVGSVGTFQMSGGVLNAPYINLPQMWGTDPVITGHWIMDGGVANADWLRLGGDTGAGVGRLELNGGVINLAGFFTIEGTDSLMDIEGGIMNIHFVEGETGPTVQDIMSEIEMWIDAGYITAYDGAGTVMLGYDAAAENVVIWAPEPATLSFLLVGGLLMRRKK